MLSNVYQHETGLRTRPGLKRVAYTNSSGVTAIAEITGIFTYVNAVGDTVIVLATPDQFYAVSGLVATPITPTDTVSYADPDDDWRPWVMVQFLSTLYCCRRGAGTLKRVTDTYSSDAGVDRPSSAPTLGNGAAGAILAGDYAGVVTYVTSAGVESDISDASATYTAPGGDKINWSTLPVSTDPQVTLKRLYRTFRNQAGSGTYYFVAEVDAADTTYTGDNLLTSQLGEPASFRNGTPPTIVEALAVGWERMFVTDGVAVYKSEPTKPENYGTDSVIQVNQNDGQDLRALYYWDQHGLFIGKTGSCWLLQSSDGFVFNLVPLSRNFGCVSHHSVRAVPGGGLVWLGESDVYISYGYDPQPIGDQYIKDLLASMLSSGADPSCAVSAVWADLDWYILSIPVASTSDNTLSRRLLVYNYKLRVWTVFTYNHFSGMYDEDADPNSVLYSGTAPRCLHVGVDSSGNPILYGAFWTSNAATVLYNLVSPDTGDDGDSTAAERPATANRPFVCKGLSKAYAAEAPSTHFSVRSFQLDSPGLADETLTMRLYRNGSPSDDAAPYAERTDISLATDGWKHLGVSTVRDPSTLVQFYFSYAGRSVLQIAGLAWDAVTALGRRGRDL